MNKSLYYLFAKQVNQLPEKIAVEDINHRSLSFADLLNDIECLSEKLKEFNSSRPSFVGINIDASCEYIIALFAVNKVRRIFAPMGSAYPQKRIQTIINKTGMQCILTVHKDTVINQLQLVDHNIHKIHCPSGLFFYLHTFKSIGSCKQSLDDVAYLLSTSGSTGEPKLILGSEKGLLHFIHWQQTTFQLDANTRGSFLSPVTFDVSLRDILTPLLVGGTVVIPNDGIRRDPCLLLQWLESCSVNLSHMVPTIIRGLLSEISSTNTKSPLAHLKYLFSAGEALHKHDVAQWQSLVGRHVQIINLYGPSETSLAKLYHPVDFERDYIDAIIPLGKPLPDTELKIIEGELCIKTPYCSKGYLDLPEQQEKVFLPTDTGAPLYLTGDLVELDASDLVCFKGRKDHQVKLRGQRIELLEIENALKQTIKVQHVVAAIKKDLHNEEKLVAYIVADNADQKPIDQLRAALAKQLPDYMLPSVIVYLNALPTNANGKVDRQSLPELSKQRPILTQSFVQPKTQYEKTIASIWCDVLALDKVGIDDNFFDLGGTSKQVLTMLAMLRESFTRQVTVAQAFQYATPRQLGQYIEQDTHNKPRRVRKRQQKIEGDIAIVGVALKVPEADDIATFWQNLLAGKNSISHFAKNELDASQADLSKLDNYVAARGVINDAESFDYSFFKYTEREAQILDPQQRLLLQLSQSALDDAGLLAKCYEGNIGVFAGVGDNGYYQKVLLNHEVANTMGEHALRLANEKDYVAPRIAYTLNLKGMAVSVHTACSTSLVATCQGVEALRAGKIDAALCGGAYIPYPLRAGHLYTEGGFSSRDGSCRPFDADASGTLFSAGAGVVILKRLQDAIDENDHIYAVIKGVGVNNDGGGKMSFMSPSVDGQAEAIQMAVDDAGVPRNSIDYIEAHGTATPLGDPIEVEALSRVYKPNEDKHCLIGSVKSNLGHLDAAAGVVGLIKSALSLRYKVLPPSINYQTPNASIPFDDYRFQVNDKVKEFKSKQALKRIAVSAFGVGGTNAHIILDAAPSTDIVKPKKFFDEFDLLLCSANSDHSLAASEQSIQSFIQADQVDNLSSIAANLALYRAHYTHRSFAVCNSKQSALNTLQDKPLATYARNVVQNLDKKITFLFPGQGSQHVGMGACFYQTEPIYTQCINECAELLLDSTGWDLREILYPETKQAIQKAEQLIQQTEYAQPALFVVCYAMAKLWQYLGVNPDAMAGHSIGEYVAACLAGVFSLEDALAIVAVRGRLMQSMPEGDMLSVSLSETEVSKYIDDTLSIAAVNARDLTVVAGDKASIQALSTKLDKQSISNKLLLTSHAFHSHMMEPMLRDFENELGTIKLHAPAIKIISTSTAQQLQASQSQGKQYWSEQVRNPVRFYQAIETLWSDDDYICLEIGPRATATSLANQVVNDPVNQMAVSSLGKSIKLEDAKQSFLFAIGQLWAAGVAIDWLALYSHAHVTKIPLPAYVFDKFDCHLDSNGQIVEVENSLSTFNQSDVIVKITHLSEQFTGAKHDKLFDQSFISLGLDSLSLTQFSLAIQKHFSVQIPVSRLLTDCNTPEHLAEQVWRLVNVGKPVQQEIDDFKVGGDIGHIDADDLSQHDLMMGLDKEGNSHWYKKEPDEQGNYYEYEENEDRSSFKLVDYKPFRRGTIESVVPMTQSQAEIWLSTQQDDDASRAFNLSLCISFEGKLKVNLLKRALYILVARHEALRSTFSADKLAMVIYSDIGIKFDEVVLSCDTDEECLKQLKTEENLLCNELFDLANGPLFRVCLFKLNDERHALSFVAHHMIVDGWSLDLLILEVESIYNNLNKNQALNLPEAYSIAKYNSASVSKRLEQAYIESERYWVDQYERTVPILDLPSYKKRPVFRTYRADRCEHVLSQQTIDLMTHALPECNTTFFAFSYGVYALLLHKLSKQDDIAIGVPYAGQIATGNKNLFGHCVNMLPIRLEIDKTVTAKDFLQKAQSKLFAGQDNGLLTFSDLIGKVNIPRDTSRIPIISTTFNIDEGERRPNFDGLDVKYEYNTRQYETFELATTIIRTSSLSKIQCQYNVDLFTGEQVKNWLEIYEHLIQVVCKGLNQKLLELDSLPTSDLVLFEKWNETTFPYDKDQCVGDFVTDSAKKYPNKIAVVFEDQSYTYKELDKKSNQLAHYFVELGVKPDEFIGLYIERSIDTLLVLLAVLKSGSGYLPLDPEYPLERITFILSDAKTKVLVTQEKFVDNINSFNGDVICLESLTSLVKSQPIAKPVTTLKSHNMAYTIYTSGSTGKPKGVQVTHQNVVNFLLSMAKIPGIQHKDKLLAVTTISFDIHVLEMYLPLISGATIEVASRDLAIDGAELVKRLQSSAITVMQATPSTWRMILEAGWGANQKVKALVGGEALPKDILPSFLKNTTELWNMYGPTETTVWSSCYRINDPDATILVGQPIANTQFYVLDEQMQRVPLGTSGELYIGGDGVTNGYLYRPELSNERFIPNPFVNDPNERLYRTGDEVRFQPDGNVEYINRIDNQVKVRGYRIELGEIESVLSKYPSINQSVVVVREDNPGDARLVAYCSLMKPGEQVEHQELKSFMSKELPPYMLPHHFVILETFPLTPNGKVDKKQLPKPSVEDGLGENNYVIPEGAVEKKIALIWSDLIGVQKIGLLDNFFEIGGHSLLAVKFIVRIKEEFGIKLNFQNVILDSLQNIAKLCGSTENSVLNAHPVEEVRLPVETCYFGEGSSLYGIYHPAAGNRKEESVLICPPVSQDYVRSYRLLRMLAEQLAKQGYDVLRFDYYGTGDSLGIDYEASCSRWRKDILEATNYLQGKNRNPISIFAARLGATLLASMENIVANKVLLWDPIVSGSQHIDELNRLQKDMLHDMSNYRWGRRVENDANCFQFTAFNYSSDNIKELSKLNFDTKIQSNISLIWSADMGGHKFKASAQIDEVRKLNSPSSWYDFMRQEDVLTSPEIVKLALQIFKEK